MHDKNDLTKLFRDHALEIYGASVLENSQEVGLKQIFDCIFEHKVAKLDLTIRMQELMEQNAKKIKNEYSEQMAEEVEELQVQINSLRQTIQQQKKTKKRQTFEGDSFCENVDSQQESGDSSQLKLQLKELEHSISQKSNIKDVCTLLDMKANSSDIFKILDEMKKSIQFLSSSSENETGTTQMMDQFLREQKFINENLCPLNCVG